MKFARIYFIFFAKALSIAFVFTILTSFIFTPKTYAVAGINRTINFQGKLVNNPLKTNVNNTSYTVVFTVYDRASSGTALWTETQTVTTSDGIFRVSLGSATPFPANFNFNWDGLYLGMKVNADSEMTPRIQLTAVPFAFNAEKVSGLTVQDDAGNASTSGTLRVGNSKTVTFSGSNGLTFNDPGGSTTITFPATGSITLTDTATSQVLTNKSIGSTGLIFSGATTDITTGTNEDLVLDTNGIGRIGFNTTSPLAGIDLRSSIGTLAVASFSGTTPFAALLVDQRGTGDIFTASTAGVSRFSITNNGGIKIGQLEGNSGQCLLSGGAGQSLNWGTCEGTAGADVILGTADLGNVTLANTATYLNTVSATPSNSTGDIIVRANAWTSSLSATNQTVTLQIRVASGSTCNGSLLASSTASLTSASGANGPAVFASYLDVNPGNSQQSYAICALSSVNSGTSLGGQATAEVIDGGTAPGQASFWNLFDVTGVITPVNTTLDLLIGGVSTDSAKFGVLNVNNNLSPIATLSATIASGGSGNGIVLDTSNASIQSLRKNNLQIGGSTTGGIQFNPGGLTNSSVFFKSNGDVGIGPGNTNPSATLDVRYNTANNGGTNAVVSVSGTTSFSTLVANNSGVGDILTASKGGSTKFTVQNNGNIQFAGTTSFLGTLASAATGSQTWTLPNATGTICVSTNNCGYGLGTNWLTTSTDLKAITSINNTMDLLIGGNSTSSAQFAVLNLAGTNTPIASISAITGANATKGIYLSGDGSIQSVRKNTLTIGGDTSGSIQFNPGGLVNSSLFLKANGDIGIGPGNTNPLASLDIRVNTANSGGTLAVASISGITSFASLVVDQRGTGDIFTASTAGVPRFSITSNGGLRLGLLEGNLGECLKSGGTGASLSWGTCGNSGAAGTWTLDSVNGTHYAINTTLDTLFGGTSTASAKLRLAGSLTSGLAAVIINQTENQDIFTASKSGTPKFAIGPNGEIKVGSGLLSAGVNGQCLISAGSGAAVGWGGCSSGGSGNWWQLNSALGTLTTGNQTLDVLFSATNGATSSAKIAFLNLNGSATPIASISAITGANATKGIYLSGDGSIQSVRKNTLIIGGSTTGAIQFNPGGLSNPNLFLNSNGDIGINTTTPLASFDMRTNTANSGGTIAIASVSGQTSFAALVANNSGVGDIFTASKGGETKFVVTNSGNVGIGTTTPTDKLDVNGNIVIEEQPNSATTDMQSWSKITGTAGTIGGNNSSITAITASAFYNGSLYVGTSKSNGAEVYRYDGNNSWTKVTNTTAGTIATGGSPTANIDTVSAMIVYNGYLYIGTTESNSAEVYRYDGGTTWTKVTQATAGTIRNGGTAAIDGITSMAVHGGKLYIGTSEPASAQIYRYEGGTSWMLQNATAGTFVATNTAAVNTITSMVSFQGSLYFTTAKTGDSDFVRMNGNGAFLAMNAAGTTGSYQVYNTEGTPTGAAVTGFDNANLTVYAGKIILGMYKANAAEVYQWNPNEVTTTTNVFIRLNSAAGTIATGGTATIDAVSSITTYGGYLYIGTSESGAGQIYRYNGVAGAWTVVSQNTAGTISGGGTTAIDTISVLQPYGSNSLFAGVNDATSLAEGYSYNVSIDRSYALQFHAAGSQAGGEQGSNENLASIYFVASLSANLNNKQGNTGAFVFSHNVVTNNGSYDVAEDYPTRDDTLEPGDVVSIDTNERGFVKKSQGDYDYAAIGVYSENPALRLSQDYGSINGGKAVPVALVGRVPVKVSTENGEIKNGDPLTPSSIPGVAMKAKKSGLIIGQAMEDYDAQGVGKITAYVKSTTYSGSIAENFANVDINSSNAGKEILNQLVNESDQGLSGSNIVTDRLIASIEIVTPKMTVDTLEVNNLKAAHIEGLDMMNDRLTALEEKVATISANLKSVKVEVEYASDSAKMSGNDAKTDLQNKLLESLTSQLLSATKSVTMTQDSASAQSMSIGTSTSSGSLRVKGNALVEGVLNVIDTLTANNFIANSLATFFGDAIFKAKVAFEGPVTFSNDSGGNAIIKKGADRVEIVFDSKFEENPIINTSVTFDEEKDKDGNTIPSDEEEQKYFAQNYSYIIVNKSTKGFTIVLNKKATNDILFAWTAARIKDAKTIQSRLTSP